MSEPSLLVESPELSVLEAASVPRPPRLIRVVFVVLGIAAWLGSQALLGHFSEERKVTGEIGDGLLQLLAPVHDFLWTNERWANGLLIISSAIIDLLAFFLLGWSIFGPSCRPFIGLMILFTLRQICQALCALPVPEKMIWWDPGFPSLLVTYGVSTDLFFSGHTALAVYGAVELGRLGRRWLVGVGVGLAVFEIVAVFALRAHYTMDVFAGAVTALFVAGLAARIAPACDRWLASLFAQSKATAA
jgi:cellulose synthase/poly-beta-1,6-N-acetylglucosamine synthase-like glycosyltransferase